MVENKEALALKIERRRKRVDSIAEWTAEAIFTGLIYGLIAGIHMLLCILGLWLIGTNPFEVTTPQIIAAAYVGYCIGSIPRRRDPHD